MTDAPPAVVARQLSKRFGSLQALAPIDLTVRPNEVFGLVGPDAAGKTTLLQMLVGVVAPTTGSVAIQGFDLASQRRQVKAQIGYMSQAFSLYPDLTVAENIWFFATLRGVSGADRRVRAKRLLEATGLAPFVKRAAGALSGGMKQKLGLICTLVHQPSVLFLDEPTNGVDPVSRREFWNILGELRSQVTVVVSTPSLDEAERCDRVALLSDGLLLEIDSPAGLRGQVSVPVWEVQVSEPFLVAEALTQHLPERSVQLFGDRLHVALEIGRQELVGLLPDAFADAQVTQIPPSLEDAYVQLVSAP